MKKEIFKQFGTIEIKNKLENLQRITLILAVHTMNYLVKQIYKFILNFFLNYSFNGRVPTYHRLIRPVFDSGKVDLQRLVYKVFRRSGLFICYKSL